MSLVPTAQVVAGERRDLVTMVNLLLHLRRDCSCWRLCREGCSPFRCCQVRANVYIANGRAAAAGWLWSVDGGGRGAGRGGGRGRGIFTSAGDVLGEAMFHAISVPHQHCAALVAGCSKHSVPNHGAHTANNPCGQKRAKRNGNAGREKVKEEICCQENVR